MKPTLKAPGSTRLKLIHDEALSTLAFKFKLRHYTMGGNAVIDNTEVSRCRLTL